MLPRFYRDVAQRAITMNGRDIRDVTLASLHSQISIVAGNGPLRRRHHPQHGLRHAARDRGQIEAAAARHQRPRLRRRAGDSYRTTIGGTASGLGGQRGAWRSRALLKLLRFILADHLGLDSESERLVQQALAT